ncbi:J domain-containing protein [Chryseolinea soli]|uniref:J domain-containing protein n=1 Tax=Chryseolinea soli TaxID=2321403 RepID=A0A385SNQ8_9BACT|nr:DnaJ domain-containing protein [Chryseolinea soli]AYB32146.1 hypothetical protein D4L85_16905 [Chryseolinea soli]
MDYYQILGVSYSASAADIKRAYRRLAVSYHPDKNPDPKAHALFKDINAAYDVLSDPAKKSVYDQRRYNQYAVVVHTNVDVRPRHRDPAYRGHAATVPPKNGRPTLRQSMKKYLPWASKASQFCLAISLVLLIDYFLPNRITEEKIVYANTVEKAGGRYAYRGWLVETDKGRKLDFPAELMEFFQPGQPITFRSSLLFNVPRKVISGGYIHHVGMSLYGNFLFLPLSLFVISALGVYQRKKIEAGFNFGVTSTIVLVMMTLIILSL